MTNTRHSGPRTTYNRARPQVRLAALVLPLLAAGAFLNMGQSSCGGGGNTLKCRGVPVTHTFSYNEANAVPYFGSQYAATDGDDVILILSGPTWVQAGDGNDLVCVLGSDITVFGEEGDDEMHGGIHNDFLFGGDGSDEIHGGDGDDQLVGGDFIAHESDGSDQIYGGNGADVLVGSYGSDALYGGPGDDELFAGDVSGGSTGEVLDWLYGEEGNDLVVGDSGQDVLLGGDGNDELRAGDDLEILVGGAGNDIAYPCHGASISEIESLNYDNPACPVESESIISARLELRVGGCNRYGVDPAESKIRPYFVSLGGAEEQFFGDRTGQPEFEAVSTHIHDFLMPGTVSDIRQITIRNAHQNDDSCISRVRLGVNHFVESNASYVWLFDTGAFPGWILSPPSGDSTMTFSLDELRSSALWSTANVDPVFRFFPLAGIIDTGIDYATLTRYIEQIVLRAVNDDPNLTAWPHHTPEWVVVSPGSAADEAHVWVIMSASLPGLKDWLTITFDVRVGCNASGDEIELEPFNFNLDVHGIGHNIIQNRAGGALNGLADTLTQSIPLGDGITCTGWNPEFDDCGLWLGVSGPRNCP